MRYLLDTNVLSEPAKPQPDGRVTGWLGKQSNLDLAISVLTLGEIRKGVALLSAGRKRDRLDDWLKTELPRQFRGRVLQIDERTASDWGQLAADARVSGRPLSVIDGLLLATAASHDLTFVTRNDGDCAERGVAVLNPWEDQSPE